MILTVGNTKGGVGKTTLALNIAIARALAGRDVWLVDADPQATASSALAIRSEAGREPAIATALYEDDRTLRAQLKLMAPKFDDVIIDVGGKDAASLRAALTLSDAILIPYQPRTFDAWALGDVAAVVDLVRDAGREQLKAFAVLNMADIQGSDNRDAAEAVKEFPSITLLDAPIRRRKALANAASAGLSVLEYEPADLKARAELNQLLEYLYNI